MVLRLKSIGDGAFWHTGALKKFFFKGSVKTLGADAFRESGLTCVHLKGDMTIGKEAFMDCKSLKYVEVPCYIFSYSAIDIRGRKHVCWLYKSAFHHSSIYCDRD